AALSETDKLFFDFADRFEEEYVAQGENEERTIEETLNLSWKLLGMLPVQELKRIRPEYIEKYLETI
ncbi:V-type ATP synthase subunit B, partial [candidate division NPL-UPA2 bacterium]|nr:V-type ATP synthase subunit B [candidate division NPL-UPA2 bacterium]